VGALSGKTGLAIGMANEHSGAFVRPLASTLVGPMLLSCHVTMEEPDGGPLRAQRPRAFHPRKGGRSGGRHAPHPIDARAASGYGHFDPLLIRAPDTPKHRLVALDEDGAYATFLVSDGGHAIPDTVAYVAPSDHVVS